jgi:hypothetical protein
MSGEDQSKEPQAPLGATLTFTQLIQTIERNHQNRRLELAHEYLMSLVWGLKGLEEMGHRIAFQILSALPPQEYPKMLYRGMEGAIAETALQAQEMSLRGFLPRALPEAVNLTVVSKAPIPPMISIRLPENPHEHHQAPKPADSEV